MNFKLLFPFPAKKVAKNPHLNSKLLANPPCVCVQVCKFDMQREEASSTAKTVEVEFKQECETNMVTVCEPVTYQPPPPPPTYPPYAAPGESLVLPYSVLLN